MKGLYPNFKSELDAELKSAIIGQAIASILEIAFDIESVLQTDDDDDVIAYYKFINRIKRRIEDNHPIVLLKPEVEELLA